MCRYKIISWPAPPVILTDPVTIIRLNGLAYLTGIVLEEIQTFHNNNRMNIPDGWLVF